MKKNESSKSIIIPISNNDKDEQLFLPKNSSNSLDFKFNENEIKHQNISIDLSGNNLEIGNSRNKKINLEENKDIIIALKKSTNLKVNSLPKKRKRKILKRKRKRIYKIKKDMDEDYEINNKQNSIYLLRRNNKTKKSEKESLKNDSDEEELMDFIKKKTCLKSTLLKYKDIYRKKKNNKIIFLKEEDEEEYFKKKKEENKNQYELRKNPSKDSFDNKYRNKIKNRNNKIKKFLKKDTDNKEMKLALDTECIICCCVIKELANPDGCDHNFCKTCLIEWSQISGKCPMCKNEYNNIFIYDDGIKKQISVNEIRKKFKKEKNDENENENIEKVCYLCRKNEDEINLVLCDRCKETFCHYYCCNLKKMPVGKWFCEFCQEELKERRENKKKIVKFFL